MSITRQQAEFTLSKIKEIVAENHQYILVRKSYHDGFVEAAKGLEKRIARGDFDKVDGGQQ